MQMAYVCKKSLTKIKRIIQNPKDIKFLIPNKKVDAPGILMVIHESQELGASILALHISQELIKSGISVYIVSRQFGKMNEKYNQIAPFQIALSTEAYRKICKRQYEKGVRKALLITASTGDFAKITKECGYEVVSMIHELDQAIRMLHLENATKELLEYSDKVLFSTTVAKNQILKLCGAVDSNKIFVKPQGIYFEKPSNQEIEKQKQILIESYPVLQEKKIIAGIGNTTERKGFDIFLQTAALLPEYEFIWAGKKENYFNDVIQKYGMPSNFTYFGSMDSKQLSGVYALADVYLMCSRFDTLPSTIFDAVLFNTPVVGAKTSGGIIDVIKDDNGYLTEEAECNKFKEALGVVLEREYKVPNYSNSFEEYVKYVCTLFERI